MAVPNADLLIRLSHELGTALEMSFDPVEMRELWAEALDALEETRQLLIDGGVGVPPVVDNVLKLSERLT